MSTTETTEFKLQSTPTGGVDAAHSPYYRRLLSAGYKGYLQGTIGGASLYGVMGLVVGALAAAPFAASIGGLWGIASLAVAAGGAGVIKGSSTFGNIGSTAAINAESADLSEQRRYLLDRYYDLPEGPEGDREAEAIRKELAHEREAHEVAPPFFHWKTVAICAGLGAALTFGFLALAGPAMLAEAGIFALIESSVGSAAASSLLVGIGTLAGSLIGATVGIDRYYIRKWFDHTEGAVHGSSHTETALIERSEQVARLKAAAKADAQTKQQLDGVTAARVPMPIAPMGEKESPAAAKPVASLSAADNDNVPTTKVAASDAVLHQRLATIQRAMDIPAI